jgi:hypothetical protein
MKLVAGLLVAATSAADGAAATAAKPPHLIMALTDGSNRGTSFSRISPHANILYRVYSYLHSLAHLESHRACISSAELTASSPLWQTSGGTTPATTTRRWSRRRSTASRAGACASSRTTPTSTVPRHAEASSPVRAPIT